MDGHPFELIKLSSVAKDSKLLRYTKFSSYVEVMNQFKFEGTACAYSLVTQETQALDPFGENIRTMNMFKYLAKSGNEGLLQAFSRGVNAFESINGKDGHLDFQCSKFDREGGTTVDVSFF